MHARTHKNATHEHMHAQPHTRTHALTGHVARIGEVLVLDRLVEVGGLLLQRHTHTHARTHIHIHIHAHTRTHTHAHIHTYIHI